MADAAKITLSLKERQLVCDADWILTKHAIIAKVYNVFGDAAAMMQTYLETVKSLPTDALSIGPKISKGENYQQLPYVMLDYPRHFTKYETLAIRTLFWWGNFFSVNLQLYGNCKLRAQPKIIEQFEFLRDNGYYVCVATDPWQHHFDTGNYRPLKDLEKIAFAEIIEREVFLKLAKKISLQQWDAASLFIEETFKEMITLLALSFPNDEINPSPGTPIVDFGL